MDAPLLRPSSIAKVLIRGQPVSRRVACFRRRQERRQPVLRETKMQIHTTFAAAALYLFASAAVAQDHGKTPAPAEASMSMPKPSAEHDNLKKAEGTWDAVVEGMGMETSKGTSEMKMTLNGFWLQDHFVGSFGGQQFEGHGTTGYDPIKGKYVATWIDNMSPALLMTEGTYDMKTRTLTMTGDGYNMAGQKVKMRNLTIHKDANTVVFEMYQTGSDGKEQKIMWITYTRRATAPAHPSK